MRKTTGLLTAIDSVNVRGHKKKSYAADRDKNRCAVLDGRAFSYPLSRYSDIHMWGDTKSF